MKKPQHLYIPKGKLFSYVNQHKNIDYQFVYIPKNKFYVLSHNDPLINCSDDNG